MAAKNSNPVLQLIKRMVDDQHLRTLSDAELLGRFLEQHDASAFHGLVRRHGPMVLDVCRSVLRNAADAEDAFQATFMVLARKGSSVRKAASVGCWLHGVAYRTACNARRRSAIRQRCESQVAMPEATQADDDSYNALVLLEPDEKQEALVKDVALELARPLKGQVVGPDGQPLTGATIIGGLSLNLPERWQGAEFTVPRLNPRNVQLVFYHKDKNLGFFLRKLPGAKDEPLTITLQPCGSASGRIVDADDKPIADLALEFDRAQVRNGRIRRILRDGRVAAKTDRDGRFRAEGFVAGVPYCLESRRGEFFGILQFKPGEVKDLGEAKAKQAHE